MAGGPAPVELNADCTTCGLEGGVVELYDAAVPACRFGLPATARCNLCGITHEGAFEPAPTRAMHDVPANRCPACLLELAPRALDEHRCGRCGASARLACVLPAAALDSAEALDAALDAWAARERFASRFALAAAVFCDPDLGSLLLRIQRGEPLEIVADPFANMGVRTKGGRPEPREAPPRGPRAKGPRRIATPAQDFRAVSPEPQGRPEEAPAEPAAPPLRISVPPPAPAAADPTATMTSAGVTAASTESAQGSPRLPTLPPPASAPPRAIVYPLVSVIAADGEIHPAERALVDRFLESEGLAPLSDDEFRVHHPSAVAHLVPKERREGVVQLMCETASVDGMPDESERRVIRAYAAAWQVSDEKVEFWLWGYESMSTSLVRQLWMKLRRFVLSARWSDAGKENR
jgi:hypothetical protein